MRMNGDVANAMECRRFQLPARNLNAEVANETGA
jgi:hypothetical protein